MKGSAKFVNIITFGIEGLMRGCGYISHYVQ